jgi:RNA polymerase sigma-70 factor (ECF subfamily)
LTDREEELDEWIREMAPRAIAYARTLLPRPDGAEEVVQEVFLRLLDHEEYDLLRDGDKLLFRSITNACINLTTRTRELRSLEQRRGDGDSLREDLASPEAFDPAELAASRELLDSVERELKRLSPMQRAAVELKAMGGSLRHIADVLEVSVSNAGVLVHRGRQKLKDRLGARLPGELR